jgi:hypothetical protein
MAESTIQGRDAGFSSVFRAGVNSRWFADAPSGSNSPPGRWLGVGQNGEAWVFYDLSGKTVGPFTQAQAAERGPWFEREAPKSVAARFGADTDTATNSLSGLPNLVARPRFGDWVNNQRVLPRTVELTLEAVLMEHRSVTKRRFLEGCATLHDNDGDGLKLLQSSGNTESLSGRLSIIDRRKREVSSYEPTASYAQVLRKAGFEGYHNSYAPVWRVPNSPNTARFLAQAQLDFVVLTGLDSLVDLPADAFRARCGFMMICGMRRGAADLMQAAWDQGDGLAPLFSAEPSEAHLFQNGDHNGPQELEALVQCWQRLTAGGKKLLPQGEELLATCLVGLTDGKSRLLTASQKVPQTQTAQQLFEASLERTHAG